MNEKMINRRHQTESIRLPAPGSLKSTQSKTKSMPELASAGPQGKYSSKICYH
jgi:hypothetical protein